MMSMSWAISCVVGKRVFAMSSVFSWHNSVSLLPVSFCTPRPNLPVTPGISWLSPFVFQSSMIKRTLQYSCHENPMSSMKRQKDMTLENEPPPGQKVSNMLLGKSGWHLLITPDRTMQLGQSKNNTQLWICLMVKVKSDAVKNNIA